MTLMGICAQCAEEKPSHAPHERRRVGRGPNGELLCPRHRREAWEEHEKAGRIPGSEQVGRPRTADKGGDDDGAVKMIRKGDRSKQPSVGSDFKIGGPLF